jgi:hypothetical protein
MSLILLMCNNTKSIRKSASFVIFYYPKS